MGTLDERVVLIAGGSGALGGAVVDAVLLAGATAVVPYVVAEEVPRLRARVGNKADRLLLVETDVGTSAGATQAASAALEKFGRIDGLVHLVGGFWGGVPIAETAEADWDRMLHVNLKTLFLCARAVLAPMQRQHFGRIVAVSARAGLHGTGGIAAYSVAKGAVVRFVEALAEETLASGICVNAVAPSTIDTPANRAAMPTADHSKWVAPEEIAQVIAFLCSPAAAPTSGTVVPVFGRA